MTKPIEESFVDWESHVFGLGYGTGEEHVLGALKTFFGAFGVDDRPDSYDYQKLEAACGAAVAWLLITALVNADILEYGTSPRYAWLTKEGVALRDFVASKSVEQLVDLCCEGEMHDYCAPDSCNCGPNGYEEGRRCPNPFWPSR